MPSILHCIQIALISMNQNLSKKYVRIIEACIMERILSTNSERIIDVQVAELSQNKS